VIDFRTGGDELDALVRALRAAQRRAEVATRRVNVLTGELLARSQDWSNRALRRSLPSRTSGWRNCVEPQRMRRYPDRWPRCRSNGCVRSVFLPN
jgi:hypothetical protein